MTFAYRHAEGPLDIPFSVRLWKWEPGHSKLLLRSFSDPESDSGQLIWDYVFSGVTYLALDSAYASLRIELAEADDLERYAGAHRVKSGEKLYRLAGEATSGMILAERLDWAQVAINGGAPSALLAEDKTALDAQAVGDICWM